MRTILTLLAIVGAPFGSAFGPASPKATLRSGSTALKVRPNLPKLFVFFVLRRFGPQASSLDKRRGQRAATEDTSFYRQAIDQVVYALSHKKIERMKAAGALKCEAIDTAAKERARATLAGASTLNQGAGCIILLL